MAVFEISISQCGLDVCFFDMCHRWSGGRVTGFVFCFKQMTAYEVRISDWSSDVCSSDLSQCPFNDFTLFINSIHSASSLELDVIQLDLTLCKIGRASCRERVCQYV